jgi:hypothetical protein
MHFGMLAWLLRWQAMPAALNLLNLATYPAALDAGIPGGGGLRQTWRKLLDSAREVIAKPSLRRLGGDSVAVEGSYTVVKDYLQVVVQAFAVALLVFIALGLLQNLWRPIHIGRFDRDGDERHAATLLSIESQSSSLAAALWAPLIGWLIDNLTAGTGLAPLTALWPVCLAGLPLLAVAWRTGRHRRRAARYC